MNQSLFGTRRWMIALAALLVLPASAALAADRLVFEGKEGPGKGKSIVFISHFLDDVIDISDRITVFRNGHKVVTETTALMNKDAVIGHMIGRRSVELHMGEVADLRSASPHFGRFAACCVNPITDSTNAMT